jgi:uncharacterized protein with HEPN domain
MTRDDGYLLDMLIYARRARDYCATSSPEEFLKNVMVQDAVIRTLQVVGEAANRTSQNCKNSNPEIAWSSIIGFRNRLVHDYPGLDLQRIWDIVQNSLPALIAHLERVVPKDNRP